MPEGNQPPQPPDYVAPKFEELRRQVEQHLGIPEEEVVPHLLATWEACHQRRPVEERRLEDPCEDGQDQLDQAPKQESPDKRKPIRVTKGLMVPSTCVPDPSKYALCKLCTQEYIKLWYFTSKECTEAQKHTQNIDIESFSFTQSSSGLMLMPSHSVSAPQSLVMRDGNLSWAEMTVAKNNMVTHMQKCNWPDNLVLMFMQFYMHLDTHPIWSKPKGGKAVLAYQAKVHLKWH
jgi:hypothetical protein